jgi:hypothetical protein
MAGLTEDARFQNLRRLGHGGFGDVYAGLDAERGVEVAIKKLKLTGPESIYRFKQEFRAVEAIDHPNLVQLFELLQAGEDWVFTMELVTGDDFTRFVRPGGELDLRRLRDALRQLAAGLAHLHAAGKLHLDVKPANVLIRRDGRLKLVDFGLAADTDVARDDRTTDRSAGTLEYMAPEQAQGLARSPAADWYPVGVMIYEALSGRLPFHGGPLKVLVDKSRGDAPPLPPEIHALAPDLAALAERLVSRDPERRPTGAEICERLGAVLSLAPTLTGLRAPFVGRATELERLEAAWFRARAGALVVIGVRGPSGIGKSTLLRHFAAMTAESDGALLLTGRCHERESVPFKGVDSFVDALGKSLVRREARGLGTPVVRDLAPLLKLFPVLGRSLRPPGASAPQDAPTDATARRRAFRALRELLLNLAATQPLMITLDDLQWADYDSAELMEVVFGAPASVPLLVIAAHRNEDRARSPFLSHFEDRVPHESLTLGPLGQSELLRLVHGLAPALGDASTAAILREADGSPFLAAELARFADQGDAPVIDLRGAVAARLGGLSTGARALWAALALAAGPVPVDALAHCLPDGEALESALRPLQSDRMVWVHGSGPDREAEIAHARLAEVIVAALKPEERRALHARMAAALSGRAEVPPAEVGHHFEASGRGGLAAPHILRAAEEAFEALAFDRAARYFEHAAGLGVQQDAGGRDVRERLATALALAGRSTASAELWLTLAEGRPEAVALALRQEAAEQYLRAARLDEGRRVLRSVLSALGLRFPESRLGAVLDILRARLRLTLRGLAFAPRAPEQVPAALARRADVTFTVAQCLSPIDLLRGAAMVSRAVVTALETRDPRRVARAIAVDAVIAATRGAAGRTLAEHRIDLGRRMVDGLDADEALAYLTLCEAIAHFQGGQWARARAAAERAAEAFRRDLPGRIWETTTADAYVVGSAYWMGELDTVCRHSAERATDARARGDRYSESYFVLAIYGLPAMLNDAPAAGLAEVEKVHADWRSQNVEFQDFYAWLSRMNLAIYAAEADRASALAAEGRRTYPRSFVWQVEFTRAAALDALGRAALLARRPREARRDAKRLAALGQPWHRALADLLAGGAARLDGDAAGARDLFRRGAEAAERVDMHWYAQAGHSAHGRLIGGPRGEAEVRAATDWAAAKGAVGPARLLASLCPGA